MRAIVTALISAFIAVLVAFVVAFLLLAFNHWFGVEDLTAFGGWSLPFAFLVAVLSLAFARISKRRSRKFRYVVGALVGLVAGFGYTYGVALMLGPWFAAFSFPVLYCWMAGAVAGIWSAVRSQERSAA